MLAGVVRDLNDFCKVRGVLGLDVRVYREQSTFRFTNVPR